MDSSSLGDRMKKYERAYDIYMPSRLPVIIRIDGKNFSKWTKKCKFRKPFDETLSYQMSHAMKDTVENIEGCMFAFTQSDEASFILRNDQSLETTPWFGNRIQKIISVVSSMFTAHFNKYAPSRGFPIAYFDARVFIVPDLTEVINYLIFRQNDAVKNSISAACYHEVANKVGKKTARKLMHGLNRNKQQELLFQETGINWNNYLTKFKHGIGARCITREFEIGDNTYTRSNWEIELELPIFTQDRQYLDDVLNAENEET